MLRRDDGAQVIRLITTYYNQPRMLARQLYEWSKYPPHVAAAFKFVIVDDGSQVHSASDVLLFDALSTVALPELYRIDTDICWNQHGARNLAAQEADDGDWLLMLDIDHVLTAENAGRLVEYVRARGWAHHWYKFPRERIGRADNTRAKDFTVRGIDPEAARAMVNPGMNCFLTTRANYWAAGGYNEDFSGVYGGDSQFLRELKAIAGDPVTLNDVTLQVHTRHSVPDANETTLDRDPAPFRERLRDARAAGRVRGHEPYCRFEWRKVL